MAARRHRGHPPPPLTTCTTDVAPEDHYATITAKPVALLFKTADLASNLAPTGAVRARCTMRWKPALNAFAITFADRFPAAETY